MTDVKMTEDEKQKLRERCLERALEYNKDYHPNEIDLMRTARHFYQYITTGKEDLNDNTQKD